MNTPRNISLVNNSEVEHLFVFNMRISYNICVSRYVFQPMVIQEKFLLMFQKLITAFLTNQHACKFYILLHTKQLFVNKLIHYLVIRIMYRHFTVFHLRSRTLVGGFELM